MKKAFTLIELLVVIGILGILTGVLVAAFSGTTESARGARCLANMRNLAMGCQAIGMSSGYYPCAGSFEKYSNMKRQSTRYVQGWIGLDEGNQYTSCYTSGYDKNAEYCVTNGSIWKAISYSKTSYVCPAHKKTAFDEGKLDVAWSYAMNAYFRWASQQRPFSYGRIGHKYGYLNRADRRLLLAEIPFVSLSVQTPDFSTGASTKNDPILQYADCEGGGDEVIGFNHMSGKKRCAHVCFADGHTEKLLLPNKPSQSNLSDLTKWLCTGGYDSGSGKYGDVTLQGDSYQLLK